MATEQLQHALRQLRERHDERRRLANALTRAERQVEAEEHACLWAAAACYVGEPVCVYDEQWRCVRMGRLARVDAVRGTVHVAVELPEGGTEHEFHTNAHTPHQFTCREGLDACGEAAVELTWRCLCDPQFRRFCRQLGWNLPRADSSHDSDYESE